jgi:quercetin dioxygenase-like cupin family protein
MGDHGPWLERLTAEGLDPGAWSNGPGDTYAPHDHAYDKVIVVVTGSIDFGLPARRESIALGVGDRLELPAGIVHHATVGPDGVTCLEAHQPARTLDAVARREAGTW